jgi:hypothetical protein
MPPRGGSRGSGMAGGAIGNHELAAIWYQKLMPSALRSPQSTPTPTRARGACWLLEAGAGASWGGWRGWGWQPGWGGTGVPVPAENPGESRRMGLAQGWHGVSMGLT